MSCSAGPWPRHPGPTLQDQVPGLCRVVPRPRVPWPSTAHPLGSVGLGWPSQIYTSNLTPLEVNFNIFTKYEKINVLRGHLQENPHPRCQCTIEISNEMKCTH